MQTNFCRQTLSRHVPPKCRRRLPKMQTRASSFCRNRRQIMQTNFVYPPDGDACIFVCLQGLSTEKCKQSLSTVFGGFFADKVCLQSLSAGLVCTIWECRQGLSTCLKSLSKAFCKVVCGNADKVRLEITSFSLFSDSIINFVSSHRVRGLSLESSHQFESSCCLAQTDLHSRKCVVVCARVSFKLCTRAIQVVRACVRAFERQRAAASSEQRAASSEQQRACIAPLLFRVWEQN